MQQSAGGSMQLQKHRGTFAGVGARESALVWWSRAVVETLNSYSLRIKAVGSAASSMYAMCWVAHRAL